MVAKIVDFIQQRSREEWQQHWLDRWTDVRIWVQEHGEQGALVCFLLGVLVVLAFKFVVVIGVLLALAGYGMWWIALPQEEKNAREASRATATQYTASYTVTPPITPSDEEPRKGSDESKFESDNSKI